MKKQVSNVEIATTLAPFAAQAFKLPTESPGFVKAVRLFTTPRQRLNVESTEEDLSKLEDGEEEDYLIEDCDF